MKLYSYQISSYLEEKKKMIEIVNRICADMDLNKKKILVFNLPSDSNLGDHAQTVCIMEYLEAKYGGYGVYSFPTFTTCTYEDIKNALNRLKWLVNKDDVIVFHSGYHINDLYCNQYFSMAPTVMVQMIIISFFKKNKIIFFPQTINMNENNLEKYSQVLNESENALLMCRDMVSYNIAKRHFNKIKLLIMPDIVTTWIGRYKMVQSEKIPKSAFVALRNPLQAESIISKDKYDILIKSLKKCGYEIFYGSTVIDETYDQINGLQERYVRDKIEEFSKYSLVITDLYHGTIFSVIACTPVLVLQSLDHKIKSGVEFFREHNDFDKRVMYADRFEDSIKILENLKDEDLVLEKIKHAYFWEKYEREELI